MLNDNNQLLLLASMEDLEEHREERLENEMKERNQSWVVIAKPTQDSSKWK